MVKYTNPNGSGPIIPDFDEQSPSTLALALDVAKNKFKHHAKEQIVSQFPFLEAFIMPDRFHQRMMRDSKLYRLDHKRREKILHDKHIKETQEHLARQKAETAARHQAEKEQKQAEREAKEAEEERIRQEEKRKADWEKQVKKAREDAERKAKKQQADQEAIYRKMAMESYAQQKKEQDAAEAQQEFESIQEVERRSRNTGYFPNLNRKVKYKGKISTTEQLKNDEHKVLDENNYVNNFQAADEIAPANDDLKSDVYALIKSVDSIRKSSNLFRRKKSLKEKDYDGNVAPILSDLDKEVTALEKKIEANDKSETAKEIRKVRKELNRYVKRFNDLTHNKRNDPDGFGAREQGGFRIQDVHFNDTKSELPDNIEAGLKPTEELQDEANVEAGMHRIADANANPDSIVLEEMNDKLGVIEKLGKEQVLLLTDQRDHRAKFEDKVNEGGPSAHNAGGSGGGGSGEGGGTSWGERLLELWGVKQGLKALGGLFKFVKNVPVLSNPYVAGAAVVGSLGYMAYRGAHDNHVFEERKQAMRPDFDKVYGKDFMDKAEQARADNFAMTAQTGDIPFDMWEGPGEEKKSLKKLVADEYKKRLDEVEEKKKRVEKELFNEQQALIANRNSWLFKNVETQKKILAQIDELEKKAKELADQKNALERDRDTKAKIIEETVKQPPPPTNDVPPAVIPDVTQRPEFKLGAMNSHNADLGVDAAGNPLRAPTPGQMRIPLRAPRSPLRGNGPTVHDASPDSSGGGARVRGATRARGNLSANQKEAYNAARAEGLSDTAARALVANMSGEALAKPGDVHPDPSRSNPNQKAHGIVQWDDTRAEAIKKQFGKYPQDMTVAEQTKAAIWEIKNNPSYAKTWQALQGSDRHAMIGALVENYERPLDTAGAIATRTKFYNGLPESFDAKQETGKFGKPDMAFGDSTAHRLGLPGDSKDGRNPRDSLNALKDYVSKNDVKGKNVVISGVSNDPSQGGVDNVMEMARILKEKGANVNILGMGPGGGHGMHPIDPKYNKILADRAAKMGIPFTPMGPTADSVHEASAKDQLRALSEAQIPGAENARIDNMKGRGQPAQNAANLLKMETPDQIKAFNTSQFENASPLLTPRLVQSTHEDAYHAMSHGQSTQSLLEKHIIDRDKKEKELHDMKRPIKPVAPPNDRLRQLFTTKAPNGGFTGDI